MNGEYSVGIDFDLVSRLHAVVREDAPPVGRPLAPSAAATMDLRVQYLGIVDLEVGKYERPIWFARRSDAFENLRQKLAAGQNTQFPTTSLFRSARLAAATEGGQQAVVVARLRPSLAVIERPSAVRPRSLGRRGCCYSSKAAISRGSPVAQPDGLVSPPGALALDVFARSLAEIGRADDDDLEALRPGFVASPSPGRDAHHVPLLEVDDLGVEFHPPAPAHDHVHLLLLLVRVAVRKAIAGRDALIAQAGLLELERL